jgi:hypothetical protein
MTGISETSKSIDAWLLNVVGLRSGAILQLDRLAEQPEEQRPLTLAMILSEAAEHDPAVGEGLQRLLPRLHQDTLARAQPRMAS